MRVPPSQDHGVRADQDVISYGYVIEIARVADPDILAEAGARVFEYHSGM